MLSIVLSGPQAQYVKARKALAAAGFTVALNDVGEPDPYDWGMAPNHETEVVDGVPVAKPTDRAMCFVTVHGESADAAHAAVENLGWRLRAHFDKPELPAKRDPVDILRELGIEPGDLRKLVS